MFLCMLIALYTKRSSLAPPMWYFTLLHPKLICFYKLEHLSGGLSGGKTYAGVPKRCQYV